jgi:hypothetical protein
MAQARNGAFALIMFDPERVITSSEEFLIEGQGVTVRVPLQKFLEAVDWAVLSTKYHVYAQEQDKIRKTLLGRETMIRDVMGYIRRED